jgi:hypothetical protein
MCIKAIKITVFLMVSFINFQVYATPAVCLTGSSVNTKESSIEGIKSTPKLLTTDKHKKSKSSSSYFGLFKMLIPNTSK